MNSIEEQVITSAKAGYSQAEISKMVQLPPTTILRILSGYNIVAILEPRGTKRRFFSEDQLVQLVAQGLTIGQIASTLGIGYSSARYWLQRYNLNTCVKARSWRKRHVI